MIRVLIFCFCLLSNLVAADSVFTTITSKNIEVSLTEGISNLIFLNDVNINSENFNLKSDRVEVQFECDLAGSKTNKKQIKKIIASNHARFVQKYRCGEADMIVVDVEKQQLSMIGNAKIKDSKGVLCGQHLTIDNNARTFHAGQSTQGQNVMKNKKEEDLQPGQQ